jgi:hypothetical protein
MKWLRQPVLNHTEGHNDKPSFGSKVTRQAFPASGMRFTDIDSPQPQGQRNFRFFTR